MLQLKISRALLLCALCAGLSLTIRAQSTTRPVAADAAAATSNKTTANDADIEEVRRELREQQEEIKRMRAVVNEQSQVIDALRQRFEQTTQAGAAQMVKTSDIPISDTTASAITDATPQTTKAQANDTDARLSRVEQQAKKTSETLSKQLGSITFSGDLRLRCGDVLRAAAGLGGLQLGHGRVVRRLRLDQRRLERAVVDPGQRLAGGHLIADVYEQLHQPAG